MLKRGCKTNSDKTCKNEVEKKLNKEANSVDPDEMAHESHLIWIYNVCPDLFTGILCNYKGLENEHLSSR